MTITPIKSHVKPIRDNPGKFVLDIDFDHRLASFTNYTVTNLIQIYDFTVEDAKDLINALNRFIAQMEKPSA